MLHHCDNFLCSHSLTFNASNPKLSSFVFVLSTVMLHHRCTIHFWCCTSLSWCVNVSILVTSYVMTSLTLVIIILSKVQDLMIGRQTSYYIPFWVLILFSCLICCCHIYCLLLYSCFLCPMVSFILFHALSYFQQYSEMSQASSTKLPH